MTLPGMYLPNWLTKYTRSPSYHVTPSPSALSSRTQNAPQQHWAGR
jgi:hypothetical protein